MPNRAKYNSEGCSKSNLRSLTMIFGRGRMASFVTACKVWCSYSQSASSRGTAKIVWALVRLLQLLKITCWPSVRCELSYSPKLLNAHHSQRTLHCIQTKCNEEVVWEWVWFFKNGWRRWEVVGSLWSQVNLSKTLSEGLRNINRSVIVKFHSLLSARIQFSVNGDSWIIWV